MQDLLEITASNKFSNKLASGAFCLQRGDDKIGNIGIVLQQLIRKVGVISGCFFLLLRMFLKEIFLDLLGKTLSVFVMGVGIEIRHHPGLRMTGITLHRFDVAAADLKLQRCVVVTQATEDNRRQIVFCDQFAE